MGNTTINDNDWFTGSVVSYKLNCTDCEGKDAKFKLHNHVDVVSNSYLGISNIVDTYTHNGTNTFVQSDSTLYVFDAMKNYSQNPIQNNPGSNC